MTVQKQSSRTEAQSEQSTLHPEEVAENWTTILHTGGYNDVGYYLLQSDDGEYVVASQRQDSEVEVEGTEHENTLSLREPSYSVRAYYSDYDEMDVLWDADSESNVVDEPEPCNPSESEFLEWVEGMDIENLDAHGLELYDGHAGHLSVVFEG